MERTEKIGVVLLNMGGPDSLEAVQPFLFNLFHDNDIITLPLRGFLLQWPLAKLISWRRARFVRGYYARIGRKSPLAKITARQALELERRLNAAHPGRFRCYVAMRYWHPFTSAALAQMEADGVTRIVALTLYPHYTTATTGSSLNELSRQLHRSSALSGLQLLTIDRWYDEPAYLDALAARVHFGLRKFAAEDRKRVMLLFSAHGLPVTFIAKGDPYVDHLHSTISGVVARLTLREQHIYDWRLSFQSRAGPTKWLEPNTEDALKQLAAEGRRDVLVVPISFVSDHIETLYEIDMLFGDEARALGLNFKRAPSLNLDARFIEALASLVERRVGLSLAAAEPQRLLPPAPAPGAREAVPTNGHPPTLAPPLSPSPAPRDPVPAASPSPSSSSSSSPSSSSSSSPSPSPSPSIDAAAPAAAGPPPPSQP